MFPTVPSFIVLGVITAVFTLLTLREGILRNGGK
jgi:hypothetical protein